MGCGPGGSFPFLVQAVGASGKVVGVEISPEVSFIARKRIARNRWENVEVLLNELPELPRSTDALADKPHAQRFFQKDGRELTLLFGAARMKGSEDQRIGFVMEMP